MTSVPNQSFVTGLVCLSSQTSNIRLYRYYSQSVPALMALTRLTPDLIWTCQFASSSVNWQFGRNNLWVSRVRYLGRLGSGFTVDSYRLRDPQSSADFHNSTTDLFGALFVFLRLFRTKLLALHWQFRCDGAGVIGPVPYSYVQPLQWAQYYTSTCRSDLCRLPSAYSGDHLGCSVCLCLHSLTYSLTYILPFFFLNNISAVVHWARACYYARVMG